MRCYLATNLNGGFKENMIYSDDKRAQLQGNEKRQMRSAVWKWWAPDVEWCVEKWWEVLCKTEEYTEGIWGAWNQKEECEITVAEHRQRFWSIERGGGKECWIGLMNANPGGGAPKWGGVQSAESNIWTTFQPEEHRWELMSSQTRLRSVGRGVQRTEWNREVPSWTEVIEEYVSQHRSAEREGTDCRMVLKSINLGWWAPMGIEVGLASGICSIGGGGAWSGPLICILRVRCHPEYNVSLKMGTMYLDIHHEKT